MNVVFWRGHVHSEWWPPPEKAYRQDKQQGLVCIMRHKYSVTWYMCKIEGFPGIKRYLSLYTQGESTVATTRTKQSTIRATTCQAKYWRWVQSTGLTPTNTEKTRRQPQTRPNTNTGRLTSLNLSYSDDAKLSVFTMCSWSNREDLDFDGINSDMYETVLT